MSNAFRISPSAVRLQIMMISRNPMNNKWLVSQTKKSVRNGAMSGPQAPREHATESVIGSHARRILEKQKTQSKILRRNRLQTVSEEEEVEEIDKSAARNNLNKLRRKEQKKYNAMFRQMCAKGLTYECPDINVESARVPDVDMGILLNILNPLGKHPEIMDNVGPWLNFVYLCYRSKTVIDVWSAVYTLRSHLTVDVRDFLPITPDMVSEIAHYFSSIVRAESLSDHLTTLKQMACTIITGEIGDCLKTIFMSFMSLKLFDKEIMEKAIALFGKPRKMTIAELCNTAYDQLVILVRFAENLWRGQSFLDLIRSKDPLLEALKYGRELIDFQNRTYRGLPVPDSVEIKYYLSEIDNVLVVLDKYYSKLSVVSPNYSDVSRVRSQLNTIRADKQRELYAGDRMVPFATLIHGSPGIGKSKLLHFVLDIWSRTMGRKYDPSQIYHRTMASTYWENYNPLSQWAIHYSEIGNLSTKLASVKGDPAVTEFTTLCDSLSFPVDCAFDDKGKKFAIPEYVIGDTNDASLNADVLVKNSAAIFRRILFLEPTVKPEFRKDGVNELDTYKCLNSNTPAMDRWTFRAYELQAINARKTKVKEWLSGGPNDDIYALTSLLEDLYVRHITKQLTVLQSTSTLYDSSSYSANFVPPNFPHGNPGNFNIGPFGPNSPGNNGGPVSNGPGDNNAPPPASDGECKDDLDDDLKTESLIISTVVGWSTAIYAAGINLLTSLLSTIFWWIFGLSWPSMILLLVVVYTVYLAYKERGRMSFGRSLALRTIAWKYDVQSYSLGLIWQALNTSLLSFVARTAITTALAARLRNLRESKNVLLGRTADLFSSYKWEISAGMFAVAGSVLAGVTVLLAVTKYVSRRGDEDDIDFYVESATSQHIDDMVGAMPQPERIPVKGAQIWNPKFHNEPRAKHFGSCVELNRSISANVRKVLVEGSSVQRTFVLGVKQDYALINTHALQYDPIVRIRVSHTGTTDETNTVYYNSQIDASDRVDMGQDLSLVRIRGCLFRDITQHFVDGEFGAHEYQASFRCMPVITKLTGPRNIVDGVTRKPIDNMLSYPFPEHGPGMCGQPIVVKAIGCSIAGIHTAGANGVGYATLITKRAVQDAIQIINQTTRLMPIHSDAPIPVESLEDPIPKSAFRYENLHGIQYYGKLPGNVLVNKDSKLKRATFADDFRECLFDNYGWQQRAKFGKPVLRQKWKDGEYLNPLNVALKKMAIEKPSLNTEILRKAIDVIKTRALKSYTRKLQPMSIDDAINGVLNDPFTRRINASTSAGFGKTGKKEDYLPIVEETQQRTTRDALPIIKERIMEILRAYDEGEVATVIYTACFKDEPREQRKIDSASTRLFFITPLEHLILCRMLLAPFFTTMVEHDEAFCSSVGINIYTGADKLAKEMKEFSELMMEGDFGSFDIRLLTDIRLAEGTIVTEMLSELGYSDAQLRLVRGLLTDSMFPYVELCKDLFRLTAQQPSGDYATAERNCIINLLMLVYCWYSTPELADKNFFEYVKPGTYGDDLIAAVKRSVAKYFNNITYQKFCERVYGIEYTPAIKDGVMTEFMEMETVTFLKRRFVFSEEFDRWIAPIDMDSIFKAIEWRMESTHVTELEQIKQTFDQMLWELILHGDRHQHENVRAFFHKVLVDNYEVIGNDLSDYDSVVQRMFS